MPTTTTNLGLYKPLVNDPTDQDLWGGYLNTNADTLDSKVYTALNLIGVGKTADYSVLSTDERKIFEADTTSANVTLTLPDSTTVANGFTIGFKKMAAAHSLIIATTGSDTIDGGSTLTVTAQYNGCILVAVNGAWITIGLNSPSFAAASDVLAGTSTTLAVTPSSLVSASVGANGYYKLPGGLTIQWGTHTFSPSGTYTTGTVVYPVAFSTATYSVTANTNTTVTGQPLSTPWSVDIVAVDVFGVSGFRFSVNGNASQALSGTHSFTWMAIGV